MNLFCCIQIFWYTKQCNNLTLLARSNTNLDILQRTHSKCLFIAQKMYFVLDFANQYIMCFSSPFFFVPNFVWYFVAKICETFSWGARLAQQSETREKNRFKMHIQLKCGESFSATHTHFLKWNLCCLTFFSSAVAPHHFNGNYNLIASFNIIIGHRQHVNGISIIYTTYRILFDEKKGARKKTRWIEMQIETIWYIDGLAMPIAKSVRWNWRWRQRRLRRCHGRVAVQREPILFILNSTTNFNGQFMKCRSKWR